ncbi:MAG: hypothetical protein K2X60_01625 [Xanthobacteraceae bacterium]|nr:hypothetical protein [Xanthobacteraceae bacterium]
MPEDAKLGILRRNIWHVRRPKNWLAMHSTKAQHCRPKNFCNREQLAKFSGYDITTFQRKPELWRASIAQARTWKSITGKAMLSFVTTEDSDTEEGAAKAAKIAIKNLSS